MAPGRRSLSLADAPGHGRAVADGKVPPAPQRRRVVNGVGLTCWDGGAHPGALGGTGGGKAMAGAAGDEGLPAGLGFILGGCCSAVMRPQDPHPFSSSGGWVCAPRCWFSGTKLGRSGIQVAFLGTDSPPRLRAHKSPGRLWAEPCSSAAELPPPRRRTLSLLFIYSPVFTAKPLAGSGPVLGR